MQFRATPCKGLPHNARRKQGSGVTLREPSFRGNKAALPSKPCQACGLPMSWRKSWAKNWAEVKYCSEACRRKKALPGG
jgi:hypothetical protein